MSLIEPPKGCGTLYSVATPIGNLNDFSPRAVETLRAVDLVAAEDTRHSRKLLDAWQINTKLTAMHEHNEQSASVRLLELIKTGQNVALISDAGTPLISDPGQKLIQNAVAEGIPVCPIPGACAATAALSAAGLPAQPHWFEGFLPSKGGDRRKRLEVLAAQPVTLVFYEAPHRIHGCLVDMASILGGERKACVAREITKKFEEFLHGSITDLAAVFEDSGKCRGEMVVLIEGHANEDPSSDANDEAILTKLLPHMPVKAAAALASELTGSHKNALYQLALSIKNNS